MSQNLDPPLKYATVYTRFHDSDKMLICTSRIQSVHDSEMVIIFRPDGDAQLSFFVINRKSSNAVISTTEIDNRTLYSNAS